MLALWIGLLAVLTGLAMPVTMLAADMRTGQLGGVCLAGKQGQQARQGLLQAQLEVAGQSTAAVPGWLSAAMPDVGSNPASGAAMSATPCDSCGFLAWLGLPPPPNAGPAPGLIGWLGKPGFANGFDLPRPEHGLPPSRAPPIGV